MSPKETVTIRVDDLELYIAKGLYDIEDKIENHFRISAALSYTRDKLPQGSFLNYEQVADILNTAMHSSDRLLETVASKCLQAFVITWPFMSSARISIKKCNPAFAGLRVGSVGVDMSWEA